MTENILFEIEIKINSITEIRGDSKSVSVVYFRGNVFSRFFKGKVMPGAADTQIHYKDRPTTLSARYVLEGTDREKNKCKIFIENNGAEKDGSIITKPFIVTDSPALKWIETANLFGRVVSANDNIIIQIYEEEKDDNKRNNVTIQSCRNHHL